MSLATRRLACAASSAESRSSASSSSLFELAVDLNAPARPSSPLTRSASESTRWPFSGRSRPGASRSCARFTFCCSCAAMPRIFCSIEVADAPGVVSTLASRLPFAVDCVAICCTSSM